MRLFTRVGLVGNCMLNGSEEGPMTNGGKMDIISNAGFIVGVGVGVVVVCICSMYRSTSIFARQYS